MFLYQRYSYVGHFGEEEVPSACFCPWRRSPLSLRVGAYGEA